MKSYCAILDRVTLDRRQFSGWLPLLEASHGTANAVFGYMMATPRFIDDLKAARLELRTHLELPTAP